MKRTNPPSFPMSYGDELFDLYADKATRRAVLTLYRNTPARPHAEALAPRLREHRGRRSWSGAPRTRT